MFIATIEESLIIRPRTFQENCEPEKHISARLKLQLQRYLYMDKQKDPASLELRTKITRAAAKLYTNNRNQFTFRNIAASAGCRLDEVQSLYSAKNAILEDFYNLIPGQFRDLSSNIPDYAALTIGEKISNYLFTTFDLLSEEPEFVKATFGDYVLRRRISRNSCRSGWERESAGIFRDFVESDDRIPEPNKLLIPGFLYQVAAREYLRIVQFWLTDPSPGTERTLALVDKLTAFFQEILYSGILDRGADLVKFAINEASARAKCKSGKSQD